MGRHHCPNYCDDAAGGKERVPAAPSITGKHAPPPAGILAASADTPPPLVSQGVEVIEFDFLTPEAVADYCYERGFLQLLWECGGTLSAPAIASGVIHKVAAFVAPKIIGGERAPTPVGDLGFVEMTQAVNLVRTPPGTENPSLPPSLSLSLGCAGGFAVGGNGTRHDADRLPRQLKWRAGRHQRSAREDTVRPSRSGSARRRPQPGRKQQQRVAR